MLDVTNSAPGAWDEDKLPLAKLTGKAEGTATDLLLSALLLDFGAAGKLAGDGRLRGRKLDLDLVTRRLDLHRLHSRLRPTQLAGTIRAKAAQDAQRVTLNLTEKNGRIDAAVRIDKRSLTVEQVRASAAGGSVIAHGKLGLEGDRPLAFKGTVTNFDPSCFGKYPKARINSRFDATGSLAPILQLTADLDVFDSQVNGAAAAGKIRWRSKGTQDARHRGRSRADVGETHARAQGTLFDPVHVGKLDIQLSLQGNDLADLFPIVGIPLPPTPPYQLSGHLLHHEDVWTFHQFSGKVGQSDLAGDFTVDRGQRVADVARGSRVGQSAASRSRRLHRCAQRRQAPSQARERAAGAAERAVQPREDPLARTPMCASVGRRIVTQAVPIDNMTAHLRMSHGVVTIDPLDFGMAGGNIVGKVTLDANQSVIAGTRGPADQGAASRAARAESEEHQSQRRNDAGTRAAQRHRQQCRRDARHVQRTCNGRHGRRRNQRAGAAAAQPGCRSHAGHGGARRRKHSGALHGRTLRRSARASQTAAVHSRHRAYQGGDGRRHRPRAPSS